MMHTHTHTRTSARTRTHRISCEIVFHSRAGTVHCPITCRCVAIKRGSRPQMAERRLRAYVFRIFFCSNMSCRLWATRLGAEERFRWVSATVLLPSSPKSHAALAMRIHCCRCKISLRRKFSLTLDTDKFEDRSFFSQIYQMVKKT